MCTSIPLGDVDVCDLELLDAVYEAAKTGTV